MVEPQPFPIGSAERYYRLRNVSTGRCLNNHSVRENRNGGRATVTGCSNHFDQQWQLSPTPQPGWLNSRATLRNRGTGRCLSLETTTAGSNATVFDCSEVESQNWRTIVAADSMRIYFQNMALLVSPASYKGRDRQGAIKHLIAKLRESRPDVVGLAEVFADGEREQIVRELGDIYPSQNMTEGPDRQNVLSDGGLLMLSRHPVVERSSLVFENGVLIDRLANKGILRARIRFPNPLPDIDIYLTHLQDPDAGDGTRARESTYAQAGQVRDFVEQNTGVRRQAIIMGDFNIDSLSGGAGIIRTRMPGVTDLWRACDSRGAGITLDSQRDFDDGIPSFSIGSRDLFYRRNGGQRIDYFFSWPETIEIENCSLRLVTERFVPSVIPFCRDNPDDVRCRRRALQFDLSDHYGLMFTRRLN